MSKNTENSLYHHLRKLSAVKSEDSLQEIVSILWNTRKTGLSPPQKSHIQSLLNLPSLAEVELVLACLRSLIRRFAHEEFTGDDLLKLFPPDLPLDPQKRLITTFQKYQNQWKEEISKEQHRLPWTTLSDQSSTGIPPSLTVVSSTESAHTLWPHQENQTLCSNLETMASTLFIADNSMPHLSTVSLQRDTGTPNNLENLPHLKSMTWTMENQNSAPSNRVAEVSLKLQDYTKDPSGEIEVKFRLTRDTVEAMLRSITYIKERLSKVRGTPSEPTQKKQRQIG